MQLKVEQYRRGALVLLAAGSLACGSDSPVPSAPEAPAAPVEARFRTPFTDEARSAVALPGGQIAVVGLAEGRIAPADGTDAFPLFFTVGRRGEVSRGEVYRDVVYGEARDAVRWGESVAVLVYHRASFDDRSVTIHRVSADGERQGVLFEQSRVTPTRHPLLRAVDGGLLVSLLRSTADAPDLLKLDSGGSLVWSYRMPEVQAGRLVTQTTAGDIFVVHGYGTTHVARLDAAGRERWRRAYAAEGAYTDAVAAVADGVALVSNRHVAPREVAVVVTRLDGAGDVLWQQQVATTTTTAVTALAALRDGGLAVGYGERYAPPEAGVGSTRSWVVALGADGATRWRQLFGPAAGSTWIHSMSLLDDGRLAVVGSTGPEQLDGYGGDDLDALVTLYAPQ